MPLTKEDLLSFGLVETSGEERVWYPMKKVISVKDSDDKDAGELAICVTTQNNATELVLATPDGCLYLGAETIEELKVFEKCILSWEPNF